MKIGEAFLEYERGEIIAANLSKNTLDNYRNAAKLLIKYLGDVYITHVTVECIRNFYQHLLTWQKPNTARNDIIRLKKVFMYLLRKGHKVLDPEDIKIPKPQKNQIVFLTEFEIKEFIEFVGQKCRGYPDINRLRNVAICELFFATGMRVSELCTLNRDTVKNRQFTVIGKSKNPRIGFITKRIENILKDYLKIRTDVNPALFINGQNGKRITPCNIRQVFRFACKRSDGKFIDIHPHTLRHSFATNMLDKRIDIRHIAEFMGHESLNTTMMYTHYSNPKLRQIYEEVYGD